MYKKFLFPIFLLFLFSFTSASIANLGTFQLNTCIDIIQISTNSTFNNVTSIEQPNGTSVFLEVVMEQNRSRFIYTTCNFTSIIGSYGVSGHGDINSVDTNWNFNYDVTKSGTILDISESVIYLLLLVGSFLVFLFFLFFSIRLKYNNETQPDGTITRITKTKYLKMATIWFAYGSLVWFFTILLGIANNFITLDITLDLINSLYIFFYILFWVLTMGILGLAMIEIYRDIFLNKELIKFGKAFVKQ